MFECAVQCVQLVREVCGQALAELEQRGEGGLPGAEDSAERGFAQGDGDGQGLLVVQYQRRHPGSGAEPVAAPGAGRGFDSVAQVPQPGDVPADCAVGDRHAFGQFTAGPFGARGQQRHQAQQTGGGPDHSSPVFRMTRTRPVRVVAYGPVP